MRVIASIIAFAGGVGVCRVDNFVMGMGIEQQNNQNNVNYFNLRSCDKFRSKAFMKSNIVNIENPTLLLSFPGAGNTWTRLLIETLTGVHSGSIYIRDRELMRVFQVEGMCEKSLSVIKGHPSNFDRCGDALCLTRYRAEVRRCNRGHIKLWTKFLFLSRHPLKSIFAEFQREITGLHAGFIAPGQIDKMKSDWLQTSLVLAEEISLDWCTP